MLAQERWREVKNAFYAQPEIYVRAKENEKRCRVSIGVMML
jgi:hypothetical protein